MPSSSRHLAQAGWILRVLVLLGSCLSGSLAFLHLPTLHYPTRSTFSPRQPACSGILCHRISRRPLHGCPTLTSWISKRSSVRLGSSSDPRDENPTSSSNISATRASSPSSPDASGDRTISFDQAGASLIQEEDEKRLKQMGDFDANPAYQSDNIEQVRAAIRARTAEMGIEKSKATAEYIEAQKARAIQGGPGQQDPDRFGGLDLSKISDGSSSNSRSSSSPRGSNPWDEDMPSMFYDPEDEMTQEEKEEVDPLMKESLWKQALNEFANSKWPTWGSALREVALMFVVVALSALLIIGWDKVLRFAYTTAGFIPSQEDLANYAKRFDGLDLPSGWMNNMSEQDVAKLADTVNMPVVVTPPVEGLLDPTAGL